MVIIYGANTSKGNCVFSFYMNPHQKSFTRTALEALRQKQRIARHFLTTFLPIIFEKRMAFSSSSIKIDKNSWIRNKSFQ